jgi:hypothetical protein
MSRKQGLPERERGAPYFGDLTAKANIGGRQTCAPVSGPRLPPAAESTMIRYRIWQ